jgi:hypothetical protein
MYASHVGLTVDYDQALQTDLKERHILARRFARSRTVLEYDGFDFAAEIKRLLILKGIVPAVAELSLLHQILSPEQMALGEDELNAVSRAFYETDSRFLELYRAFIAAVACELGSTLYYQATPTIRFHFPYEQGFDWHPRYHTDVMLGHPPAEVNVWVPITPAFGSNSLRLAGLDDSKTILKLCDDDFAKLADSVQTNPTMQKLCKLVSTPVELEPPFCVLFHPLCLHATQCNTTDRTRVSLDCRVITKNAYQRLHKSYQGTGRQRMAFAPGAYYDRAAL